MEEKLATLHMVCGKVAAGKSTLTSDLGSFPATVVIREDEWLPVLFPDNSAVKDYGHSADRLKRAMEPHVVALLKAGMSVVLDFPANTVANRNWMRSLFEAAGAAHRLHYLDVPDEICKSRLHARNATGAHPYIVTDEQFEAISQHFVAPDASEGFDLVTYRPGS